MSTKNIQLSVKSDLDLFQRDAETTRILEVVVEAPKSEETAPRPALNLALVIDRSGSMGGDKIEYARKACRYVLDLLQERDRVALVAYDHEIELHSPSVPVTPANRSLLKEKIDMIDSRGSTNLFGGWQMGCLQAAEAASNGSLNRVLLLTDGLANVGLHDPEILAMHAGELARRAVSTSTFGVGLDYDHVLLEGMANQGAGLYHYIENPHDIPRIFEAEFKELAAATAMDVELTLQLPDEIRCDVLGGWKSERSLGKLSIQLGSLYAGRREPVYIRLVLPAGLPENLALKACVRARLAGGDLGEADAMLELRPASRAEIESVQADEALIRRYTEVEMAEKAAEALKLERQGERETAAAMMRNALHKNAPYIGPSLKSEYKELSERMSRGLNEQDRKLSHDTSYQRRKSRMP